MASEKAPSNNAMNSKNSNISKSSSNQNFFIKHKKKLIVIGIIIFLFIIYRVYRNYKKKSSDNKLELLKKIHDGKTAKTIPGSDTFKNEQGNEINYNFWLYISDYRYNFDYDKNVFSKEDYSGSNQEVLLLRNQNTLRFVTKLQTANKIVDSENGDLNDTYYCDIPNIPLQKWMNINISVYNSNIDIYINSKLVKSCVASGYPSEAKGKIKLCKDGGFNGFITKFNLYGKYLSIDKINKIYKKGYQ